MITVFHRVLTKMFAISYLLICISVLLFSNSASQSIQCKDHDNNPVDWFVMYKLPMQSKKTGNKLVDGGMAYLYITSKNTTKWTLSNININNTESLLGTALSPLYNSSIPSKYYVLYNDEPLNKNGNHKKGHTKGVVVGDNKSGIWIVHSVPKFPPVPEDAAYSYPTSGRNFGQSVLCVTFNTENMNKVGLQLKYNQPDIYAYYIPYTLQMPLMYLTDVTKGILIDSPPWFNTQSLQSLSGTSFLSFAKTRDFDMDLYADYVAPVLKAGLFVQTWPNGPGRMTSNCSSHYYIENVKELKVNISDSLSFSSTTDHSKWAITDAGGWICIGDINRADHQKVRGGGTVCFQNIETAHNYNSTIQDLETCPKEMIKSYWRYFFRF